MNESETKLAGASRKPSVPLKDILTSFAGNASDKRLGNPLARSIVGFDAGNPLLWGSLVGLLALVAFAWMRDNWIMAFAVAFLIGSAAIAVGAILGFLFGIPRAAQRAWASAYAT